mmetsp:Transcript_55387/g.161686  ORF Transcript_55387/g.161686 Transcript_55387/m.161686 type:complete len:405 (+) Transcript_55387:332-1546(+)
MEEQLGSEEEEHEAHAVLQQDEPVEQVASNEEDLRDREGGGRGGREADVVVPHLLYLRQRHVHLHDEVDQEEAGDRGQEQREASPPVLGEHDSVPLVRWAKPISQNPVADSEDFGLLEVEARMLALSHGLHAHVDEPGAEEVGEDMERLQPAGEAHEKDHLEHDLAHHDNEQSLLGSLPWHFERLHHDVIDEDVLNREDKLQEVAYEPSGAVGGAQVRPDNHIIQPRSQEPEDECYGVVRSSAGPVEEVEVQQEEARKGGDEDHPLEGHGGGEEVVDANAPDAVLLLVPLAHAADPGPVVLRAQPGPPGPPRARERPQVGRVYGQQAKAVTKAYDWCRLRCILDDRLRLSLQLTSSPCRLLLHKDLKPLGVDLVAQGQHLSRKQRQSKQRDVRHRRSDAGLWRR